MAILNILEEKEITAFDSPPLFSNKDREQYFSLPNNNLKFRKIETKIGYILQEGYFLSQRKFFLPSQFPKDDIIYVSTLCGVKRDIVIENCYNRSIQNIHKQIILDEHEYKSFSNYKYIFEREAQELIKSSLRPNDIFYTLLDFLIERKIEIPQYYSFAEVITKTLNSFENQLVEKVNKVLSEEQKELLDGFMNLLRDNKLEPSAQNPYLITRLKKAEQTITPTKIKESLEDFNYIQEFYKNLSNFYNSNLIGVLADAIVFS